jgi:hypothetical protein
VADPQLVLASAPGGSAFMEELFEVIADAVRGAGGTATTWVGPLPEDRPDAVYVIVPHEYLVVLPESQRPRPEQLRRTIGLCVEHPGTRTFETAAALLPKLGATFDINEDSQLELARRGTKAHRFQLGYTKLWDCWGGDPDRPRDIDVTYLGTAEHRRSALLARAARDLDGRTVRLLTPPHEPMVKPRPDFLMGRAKHEHLARSRVLLNLHRESSTALEWVRVLESACNGCVVVTEPSSDLAPFANGKQLVVARQQVVGAVTEALLRNEELERSIRVEAYRFVREELDMTASATRLIEVAADLADRHPAPRAATTVSRPVRSETTGDGPLAVDTPSWDPRFRGEESLHAEADEVAARRLVDRVEHARRATESGWQPAATPLAPSSTAPVRDVDVLIVRRPGDPDVSGLIDDLAAGTVLPARVLVCQDGTIGRPGPLPFDQLTHPTARGSGYSWQELLTRSTAPLVLVLDATMRCTPHLLERLLAADADVAHCPVADPRLGLVGALPPESRRLATLPYLGAGYLARRELASWPDDPWLEGLEHHVFWQHAAGTRTRLVQQVLLSRSEPQPPTRPLDLDPRRVWSMARS